jgi:Protein of unknown function (DUF1552)
MRRFRLSRRALLRGSGAALSLPLLEPMMAAGPARAQAAAPVRYAALQFPCGTTGTWQPSGTELSWQLSPVLRPLEPVKADLSVLVGINARIDSNHPGHATAFLSDASIPGGGAPFRAAVTTDQVIAAGIGEATRIRNLVITPPGNGQTEEGQSGVYGSNMSWVSASTPAARATDPRAMFDSLFAGTPVTPGPAAPPATAERWARDRSVLDYIRWDAGRLNGRLGAGDKAIVDQFLTGVREVEKKIASPPSGAPPAMGPSCAPGQAPASGLSFVDDTRAKLDLLALAFQCDVTRVATYLLDFEYSQRNMNFLPGVSGVHHSISHWRDGSGRLGPMLDRINVFYTEQLAYLLAKLKAMPEAGATVLGNSMILWGSSFNDGHGHTINNIPLVLAGAGGGTLRPGRLVRPSSSSLKALHLTMIRKMKVVASSFSGGSATIENL